MGSGAWVEGRGPSHLSSVDRLGEREFDEPDWADRRYHSRGLSLSCGCARFLDRARLAWEQPDWPIDRPVGFARS